MKIIKKSQEHLIITQNHVILNTFLIFTGAILLLPLVSVISNNLKPESLNCNLIKTKQTQCQINQPISVIINDLFNLVNVTLIALTTTSSIISFSVANCNKTWNIDLKKRTLTITKTSLLNINQQKYSLSDSNYQKIGAIVNNYDIHLTKDNNKKISFESKSNLSIVKDISDLLKKLEQH
ncbi:MAG: hypothetical protein IGS39_21750 [Calothrix sp. C42_A2020_038]|nr:hypothetical protein [Calothrix sp. C42_A2020_038]